MRGLVRSLWDEPPPPDPPRRVWRDWVLVGLLVPIALIEGVVRPDLPHRVLAVALTVALVPTLLWRRTHPLRVILIVFGSSTTAALLAGGDQVGTNTQAYLLLVVYALFRWGAGREVVIGLAVMAASVGQAIAGGRLTPPDAIGAFVVMFAAGALGVALRYRSRARNREIDQVKLLEREQIARDLHDTVAHHVSAMAIRAQAGLATAGSRPDAATDALRVIEAEAARALDEMRAMVRVLRHDQPADLTPGRRLADLHELAGQGRGGPSVEVEISPGLDDLPPSLTAAIYRLAQESITNARRHARHATRVEVHVTADDTSVRLRVTDDGDGGPAASPGGYGLIGMRERAALLGGTCEAGPDPGRGWTVTAVLPRAAA
ncbi:sensor histidine kinase [Sphaerisporangium sp. B11E5]|uniref:sensor histidine kinase n=1 Tax=Sphaerisporangium sp. B11E5 TaxID=3153563 RepID=UPI00325F0992